MIFGEKKINSVTAARLQRWAIILSQYDYDISYRKAAQMGNADGLSRLPLNEPTNVSNNVINFFNITGNLPLTARDISLETSKDKYLPKIYEFIETQWPKKLNDAILEKYALRKHEYSVQEGCILLGNRVVIPDSLRHQIVSLLHDGHIGVVRMKAVARGCVWWNNIDRDIEMFVKSCNVCQQMGNKLGPVQLSSWPKTSYPFERVHIDFYYFQRQTFLILMDTFSKWINVFIMRNTEASSVIAIFHSIFSIFGLPKELVADNGPPFCSKQLLQFCNDNNVKLLHSPAYHPQSNGSAERAVQTVKSSLKKYLIDQILKPLPIQFKLDNFLFRYRNTPSTITNLTPAQLIFNYEPRTLITFLKPEKDTNKIEKDTNKIENKVLTTKLLKNNKKFKNVKISKNNNENKVPYQFENNQKVYYRSMYENLVKWIPAVILKKICKSLYVIQINNITRTVHGRQLKPRFTKHVHFDITKKPPNIEFITKNKSQNENEFVKENENLKREGEGSNSESENIENIPSSSGKTETFPNPPRRSKRNVKSVTKFQYPK